jgi:hypothetical protein
MFRIRDLSFALNNAQSLFFTEIKQGREIHRAVTNAIEFDLILGIIPTIKNQMLLERGNRQSPHPFGFKIPPQMTSPGIPDNSIDPIHGSVLPLKSHLF